MVTITGGEKAELAPLQGHGNILFPRQRLSSSHSCVDVGMGLSLWPFPIKGQVSTGGVTRATEHLEASPLEAETWWFSREGRETIPDHSGYPYMNLAPYHQRPERRGCWLHALHTTYVWPFPFPHVTM